MAELQYEAESRGLWRGDLLLVKQQRDLLADFRLMGYRTAILLLVTLPLWRGDTPMLDKIPYILLVLFAFLLLWLDRIQAADIRKARHPSSWLLASTKEGLWIKLRSWHHNHWAEEKVVIEILRDDVVSINALKNRAGVEAIDIILQQPLSFEVVDAIQFENNREDGAGQWRRRYAHAPVRIGRDGAMLRIFWDGETPGVQQALDKLRLNYNIIPARSVTDPEAALLPLDFQLQGGRTA